MQEQSFDIFFLSYNETDADINYEALVKHGINPHRVDGITGIKEAHTVCASKSKSSHFFVIDADSYLLPDVNGKVFDFSIDFVPQSKSVYVWRCKNAVNDLVYGYGAIKLFAVDCFDAHTSGVDMSTSVADRYVIINDLISETRFNTSPFEAWKSGFREAAKLSSNVIKGAIPKDNEERLSVWTTTGAERKYGKWCMLGAQDGVEYVKALSDMSLINNFEALRKRFDSFTKYGK